jgi:hypothetical protein
MVEIRIARDRLRPRGVACRGGLAAFLLVSAVAGTAVLVGATGAVAACKPGGIPGSACSSVSTSSSVDGGSLKVVFRPTVIDLFRRTLVSVTGTSAGSVSVRLKGATDEHGRAYEYTPYPWQRLRLRRGVWRGELASPALRGVYQLQVRLRKGAEIVQSRTWLLRIFRPRTLKRPSFRTAVGAINQFVHALPGDQVLVALRRQPQAAFDRRDSRMNQMYAIAYAPRTATGSNSRRGLFITTVRDGFHGRWRLLAASVEPYS